MLNRWYIVAIFACWVASMGWLLVEKVLPTLDQGDQPEYADVLPVENSPPRHIDWELQYGSQTIGQAKSLAVRESDGSGRMESTVQFDNLPLGEIMSELLGFFGPLLKPMWNSNDDLQVSMTVESKMQINSEGRLESFVTDVKLAELPNLIRVEGEVHGTALHVKLLMADDAGELQTRFSDEIDIGSDAMVSGMLSPQDRLRDLEVGQTWTTPVYRPFQPKRPVQMLQATVERHEVFIWNNQSLKAYQVVFRDDAGTGITIAREPVGRMWIRDDGEVLQQEARIASMRFRFVRLPDEDDLP